MFTSEPLRARGVESLEGRKDDRFLIRHVRHELVAVKGDVVARHPGGGGQVRGARGPAQPEGLPEREVMVA